MDPEDAPVAFIGSPGVGKSILFFLAAIFQAQTRKVIYYRCTRSRKEQASFFFMSPEGSGSAVCVWFTRNFDKDLLDSMGGLSRFGVDLREALPIPRGDYLAYVDGPHHDDRANTFTGTYDYFCTSGGMRRYKSEEFGKRLWVLDGWTREEAIQGLAMAGHDQTKAKGAYSLCGGNIREMLQFCHTPETVKHALDELCTGLDRESVELAITSTERLDQKNNPDRLRTMFELKKDDETLWKERMSVYQVVDSPYLLERLSQELGSGPFRKAYGLSRSVNLGVVEGIFFELTFHKHVQEIKDKLRVVADVCWSKGTGAQGLEELDKRNLYWIPSTSNFKAVDSAIVVDSALYVFQMTKQSSKEYAGASLEREFVSVVRKKIDISRTVVVFISPRGTNFRCGQPETLPGGAYEAREVDMTSGETIDQSLRRLFDELGDNL
jgi:hypothetical protein